MSDTQPENERDTRGRFVKGCKPGPGNPHGRRIAILRSTLIGAITEDDIKEIVKKLVELARNGDLQAVKLLLSYAIGQPTPAPDPDRVDADDFRLRAEESKARAQKRSAQESELWDISMDQIFGKKDRSDNNYSDDDGADDRGDDGEDC